MKRGVFLGSMALLVMACAAPKEPKQAAAPDPITDDSASDSTGDSPRHSSASSNKGTSGATGSGIGAYLEGLHWGMSHGDVDKVFTQTDGVIWRDYDQKLAKARVGPEMTALEAERDRQKAAFSRSFTEFKDTPTGYDATGIKGEYTYKNHESLMWVQREGKKRYFFFINDRLWKIYDEVPFGEGVGASYVDAVNALNGKFGTKGQVQKADPAKGINATSVNWKDNVNQLRALDRSGEGLVGLVIEDASTAGNIASLRSNKMEDPTAIDPTITAVTRGGLSDPNAAPPENEAAGKTGKAGKNGAKPKSAPKK